MKFRSKVLHFVAFLGALTSVAIACRAAALFSTERQVVPLGNGVYMIRHKDPYPGWVHGNTTVVIGERAVFVVDSCQLPGAAEEDIAQIRKWTDKPVAYLLNTHWHQDHNGGNKTYMDAFPGITIIARAETREMMDLSSPKLSVEILKQADQIHQMLSRRLETGKDDDGSTLTDARRATTKERLAMVEAVQADAHRFVYQPPTLTFDRELTIDLGNREVKVMFLGRGNTEGDAIAYLPKEKILASGDLVVEPVPFADDGYPSEWISTLERLDAMDTEIIVPGHGEVMRDKAFLKTEIEMMKSIVGQVRAKVASNDEVSLGDVQKSVDISIFRERMCGDDKQAQNFFNFSIGREFVELAYHEAKAR